MPASLRSLRRLAPTHLPAPGLGLPIIFLAALLASVEATAQPVSNAARSAPAGWTAPGSGVVDAAFLLRQLDGVKRVLMIGAHPDDEDTALLTALARGLGARAAYLSLTRGEGGQNLIGPELGEGLGIVRTGELLAARRVDGADQFFTRAYDFGYSKTAEESFKHWPRDSLLSDVVWAIRVFRPQIIVSVFSGTRNDGHGQHQIAGLLAHEAFEAAGDARRFPEHADRGVAPWQPLKLYRRTWRDPSASTLAVETGRLDPLIGRSHHQVAMRSRSQHRSQDFGTMELGGPRVTLLKLVESRVSGPDTSLFSGVDTTLTSLARVVPPDVRRQVADALAAYRAEVETARLRLAALEPARALPALVRALAALRSAREKAATGGGATAPSGILPQAVDERLSLLQEAILAAASITIVAEAGDDIVVPGQSFWVRAKLWSGGGFSVEPETLKLAAPAGWTVAADPSIAEERGNRFYPRSLEEARRAGRDEDGSGVAPEEPNAASPEPATHEAPSQLSSALEPGESRAWGFSVSVPRDAGASQPYYLAADRSGDLYVWPPSADLRGRGFDPPLLRVEARLRFHLEGADEASPANARPVADLAVRRPVRFRGVDKAVGEFWKPVLVLPAVSVSVEPRIMVWPAADPAPRSVAVTVRTWDPGGFSGRLRLVAPAGWSVAPAEVPIVLEAPGAVRSFAFEIRPADAWVRPPAESAWSLPAVVDGSDGEEFRQEAVLIDYPHTEPTPYLRRAETTVRRVDVRVEDRHIGYVTGSGDRVAEAIRQLGLSVEMIGPADLEANGLARFDVIVLGVRAYEVRPDLAAANSTLLDWVRRGGVLLVQYNKHELPEGGYAPYPLAIGRPHGRVADEASEVTLLDPESPGFVWPNQITARDFEGWVQERGLYFLGEWDERYTALLAVADSGEEPQLGSLVVARVGEGLWVYTGLSLFRQLPAGVPGAYRLFANLLSLEPAEWPAAVDQGG